MALRNPQALLGTFMRAGVLCFSGTQGRTCIAHGLPETPDSFSFTPVVGGTGNCISSLVVESWDATSIVFVNSHSIAQSVYVRIAVEYRQIQ